MTGNPQIETVGSVATVWGESVRWDERRQRLYFVDCGANTLHWIDDETPGTLRLDGMPTGVALTEDARLVIAMDDGLHVVDPDTGTAELLSKYPEAIGGRCNDAHADLDGNVITGKLNMGPAEGSSWQFSPTHGWRRLRDDIANTNGPAVAIIEGAMTLVIGDTSDVYAAYDYDPAAATATNRRELADVVPLGGRPDGACFDADGGLWCAVVGGRTIARYTSSGLDRSIDVGAQNPTDVAFGGPDLDILYVTTIGSADNPNDGRLLAVTGHGCVGRHEPRVRLDV